MFVHLLSDRAGSAAVTIAVIVAAVVSVLKKLIEEISRTQRLAKSIENAEPQQRSEIILACSQLERGPDSAARHDQRGPEDEALHYLDTQ